MGSSICSFTAYLQHNAGSEHVRSAPLCSSTGLVRRPFDWFKHSNMYILFNANQQAIKIYNIQSEETLSHIRYHDGFMGQKIGPTSALTFHPYKVSWGKKKNKLLPCGESNPGHGGESAGS